MFHRLRAYLRLARAALHLLQGAATVALLFPFVPESRRRLMKRRWSRQLVGCLGVSLRHGPQGAASGMLVANHVSFLDIFVLNAVTPAAFVAKEDVRAWPLIGWLCRRTETVFIERGSRRAAQRTREHVVEKLRANALVAVFPEGTTTWGDEVLPFHAALLQSAIDAGTPLTPAVIRYTDGRGEPTRAPGYVGDIGLTECLMAIVRSDGLTAHVEFLPAMCTEGVDRRHLSAHAHRAVAHALARASGRPPNTHAPPADLSPSLTAPPAAGRAG